MKILIATGIYPPDIGGPATYCQKIKEEFLKLGHQILVVTFSDKKGDKNEPGVIFGVDRGQNTFLRYAKYFWQVLKNSKEVDLVYAQGPVSAGFPAAVACLLNGKKLFLKVVGDVAWERARGKEKTFEDINRFQTKKCSGKIGLIKKIQRCVCGRAQKIIVPSQYLKNIVSGWGVPENKIEVIYNSFERIIPARLTEASAKRVKAKIQDIDAQSKLGMTSRVSILSVGRLVPWKGFDVLLEVLAGLSPEFVLKIIGDGPEEEKLKELASKLKIEDRVEFLGKLKHDELLGQMQKSDVFVLNTKYEGLAHVILEALAVGLPVVTTNIGGNPEVITHNENGLLVQPDNKEQLTQAILKIINDQEFSRELILAGQKSLEKFSEEKMISQTAQILEL